MVKATTSPAPRPPTDPVALLSTPLAQSGLTAAALLRRAGTRLGFYDVRDLLFHLPRRYDDLREMHKVGDLGLAARRNGGLGPGYRRRRSASRPGSGGRIQRTIARLEDETGSIDATWFGRRFIERRLHVGSEVVVSGQGQAVRTASDASTTRSSRSSARTTELLHAGRIVPVYRLTAGLTAVRLRSAIREALDRAGTAYPEYLPAAIRREEGLVPASLAAIEEAHYPATFEGRDAALRRLAFDELLALQLGMVERRRQRVRDAAPEDRARRRGGRNAIRTALVEALTRRVGARRWS